MEEVSALAALGEGEREQALARFKILQPFVEGQATLSAVARQQDIPLRTIQHWASRYYKYGLAGLARKRRADRGQRRVEPELQQLVEGLALQKLGLTAAAIHRRVREVAEQKGWSVPSYDCVYDIIRSLDPGLVMLAHEGVKSYQNAYDLLYRREASCPNEIWQADHSPLDIWLLDNGESLRPWLTVVEDDYSRSIMGYFLTFEAPSSLNTSLALRQAIWRKSDPNWPLCGIPEIFYSDHGSDFTSHHLEQVAADLKIRLVFSTAGVPRGRGRIERFFRTVNQLLLHRLPGYGPHGKPLTKPQLSLAEFEQAFHHFLLHEYHQRPQLDLKGTPQARWEANGFLPQMPESLEKLDLLLLTVAKTRLVRRDGIRFQNMRYVDPTLAAYIGAEVVIRYDPRDMAEIRVFHQNRFLCAAICQELAGQTISLKEIIRARNQRRRQLQQELRDYQATVERLLDTRRQQEPPEVLPTPVASEEPDAPPTPKLKRYYND